jgi:hypothetical protein
LQPDAEMATRAAKFMFDHGLAKLGPPGDVRGWIEGQLYKPQAALATGPWQGGARLRNGQQRQPARSDQRTGVTTETSRLIS